MAKVPLSQGDTVEFGPGVGLDAAIGILDRANAQSCLETLPTQQILHKKCLAQAGNGVYAVRTGNGCEFGQSIRFRKLLTRTWTRRRLPGQP